MEHQGSEDGAKAPRNTSASRRTAMRLMQRKSQGLVAVYEQDPETPDTDARALVFESRAHKVQVTPVPTEWQRLSDDDLVALQRAAS